LTTITYEEVHREFEKRFVEESNSTRRRQQEKDLTERMEFEADVRTYYENILLLPSFLLPPPFILNDYA
jgi:hypothetical protein